MNIIFFLQCEDGKKKKKICELFGNELDPGKQT